MISPALQKKAEEDLSLMIQCKTVSSRNHEKEDTHEFDKFHALLKKRYPLLYKKHPPFNAGRNGIVFYIPGTSNPEGKPEHQTANVLMAHYDVVPAEGEEWQFEPFSGIIDEDFIWGRGTLDTKATVCAVLAAAEFSMQSEWKPVNDLYLAFSGEEEIDGDSCPSIVSLLEERNVKVSFVLDEGGAIVEKAVPGQNRGCAMIGIAEKGSVSISCSISLAGGHASAPPKHTTAGLIAQAACSIEKGRFKAQFTEPVHQMFSYTAPHCAQPYKFIFSHSRFFSPVLKILSPLMGSEFNALMHTTCALTKLEASPAFNVIPPSASLGLNFRLLGKDSIESAVKWLEKRFRKLEKNLSKKKNSTSSSSHANSKHQKNISISVLTGSNPSRVSPTDCTQWTMLTGVITSQWPDVFVSPYLMMACTDSRHYGRITDKVYRFSPMPLSKEERAMIHGKNERIKKGNLHNAVEFYIQLMNRL